MHEMGPLQLLIIGFEQATLPTLAHAEIADLSDRGLIRLVDSLVVAKSSEGKLIMLDTLDAPRGDPLWKAVLAQALFGGTMVGVPSERAQQISRLQDPQAELSVTDDQLLEIADRIPTSSLALLLLVEHSWMAEMQIAAAEANGRVIANCWISPRLLLEHVRDGEFVFA